MRIVLTLCVVAFSCILLCAPVQADAKADTADKVEKVEKLTLSGNITCAKCELKESKGCHTVIVADGKTYWFDNDSSKKYHNEVCKSGKKGTVVGVVEEKDGKHWIKVASVEWAK